MTDQRLTPALARVDAAIDAGDIPTARRELLSLPPDEVRVLREELRPDVAERLFATARSRSRAAKQGKVVVLHGITGSSLDAVHTGGRRDRAWINLIRVVGGDVLRWLELKTDGSSSDSTIRIEPSGLLRKWYLPLLLELDNRWEVLPFAYDWRLDIDDSATKLAAAVSGFAQGKPVHLVVHSMGGLVARRFIQLNKKLWGDLDDPPARARGGRLIMLGTPNRGSYSIPLTLSGAETTIRILDFADFSRAKTAVLQVLNGFCGSYQMLPSPKVVMPEDGNPDHHVRLFDPASWGTVPIRKDLLDRARAFQEQLDPVTDPERLLYVAGYDQPTPFAIRIVRPGEFEYQETRDGDGRVPHRLGFLPDVRNYFVREKHGDLPSNALVLSAIHQLLEQGQTDRLSDRAAAARGRAVAPVVDRPGTWKRAEDFVNQEEAAEMAGELVKQRRDANRSVVRSGGKAATAAAARQAKTEARYLELAGGPPAEAAEKRNVRRNAARRKQATEPALVSVEVVWGDITTVKGDVYAVGHYQGVEPQNAELAIDLKLLSEIPKKEWHDVKDSDRRLPLTALTRQGLLRASLGDISLFPGHRQLGGPEVTVAIAGMGYPGTYSRIRQQQLISTLAHVATTLSGVETLCMVLIGSGVGTLQVWEAVDGMLAGLARFASDASSGPGSRLRCVRLVEREFGKAREIHAELYARSTWYRPMLERANIRLTIRPDLVTDLDDEGRPTGNISAACVLGALVAASIDPDNKAASDRLASRIDLDLGVPGPMKRELIRDALGAAGPKVYKSFQDAGALRHPSRLKGEAQKEGEGPVPAQRLGPPTSVADLIAVSYTVDTGVSKDAATRLSYVRESSEVRVAAITDLTTVSERAISVDFSLVREQMRIIQAIDPESTEQEIQQCSRILRRILLPREFRALGMGAGRIVFDVDRAMAGVPWELMQYDADDLMPAPEGARAETDRPPIYLGLQMPVARQLRTTLSPAPTFEGERSGRLRALVVGDPGDRDQGYNLEGARREALAVHALFQRLNVESTLLLGAPGQSDGYPAATRSAIIDQLSRPGRPYDILHYTGHGDFDPVDPSLTGWLCSDGILGPNELKLALENGSPLLVFANACLSGRLSEARNIRNAGKKATNDSSESGLLPSVADTFLQHGARNLVGTCREVNDEGAVLMATTFYEALIPPTPSSSIGAALLAARIQLAKAKTFGSLWAVYHHYGLPTSNIRLLTPTDKPTRK